MGKGKKGQPAQQKEQPPPAKEDKTAANVEEQSVSNLKKSLEKLSLEVKKLGAVLGVEEGQKKTGSEQQKQSKTGQADANQQKSDSSKPTSSNAADQPKQDEQADQKKNQFERPEMTAEEKKAQRAAKAAEKKLKAEASKNKKENAQQNEQQQANQPKGNQQKQGQNKEENAGQGKKVGKSDQPKAKPQDNGEIKSALRTGSSYSGKEVKFDLIASTSDDVQNAAEPEPIRSTTLIHPAFIELSTKCEDGIIDSIDELCKQFIDTTIEFVKSPQIASGNDNGSGESLSKKFDSALKHQLTYFTFNGKWPLPFALGNIVRLMRKESEKVEQDSISGIDAFVKRLDELKETNFIFAYEAISDHIEKKISKAGQYILTYDWCPLVHRILVDTADRDKSKIFCFVDDELGARGMQHVQAFTQKGVRSQYLNLNSISYVMHNCSMVVLGCAAVLSNGCVATWLGSLQVALVAKHFNVPVLVVAQTFKFVDKFGSYGRRISVMGRKELELLPADLITAVVTDLRILPPSAAPAVLKAKDLEAE
ncbi:hypothetical protein WR25_25479 [Diploscapter pachys]|uniref:Translation initiation factor eIF2B subunit delta n=1 Tax=Diploscapter pachys TaxID=2018661 RepID=A0A2A2KUD5_9BILA|nr:hypothetical protein WR25_25479 [Diploscapter pachys]